MAPHPSANRTNKNHKGKRRHFSSPEDIQRELNNLSLKNDSKVDDIVEEGSDVDEDENNDESSDDYSGDEKDQQRKPKGVQALIEIENPNRMPAVRRSTTGTQNDTEKPELSRREREELAKQQAKERYMRLTAEGKTDQAKADLARLELIRKQREEAAKKREVEQKLKNETKGGRVGGSSSNQASSSAALESRTKRLQANKVVK